MKETQDISKKTLLLISIICLQALVVLLNAFWNYMAIHGLIFIPLEVITTISLIAGFLLTMTAIYLIKEIIRLIKSERDLRISQAILAKNQDLIDVLSNHRHDFQNHLQVIMGLVQLGRNDSAVDYIKEVTGTLNQEAIITSRIKNLEVAALFITKKNQAEERNIALQLDLQSDLGGLNIPATHISRILGNLIDNALDAVEGLGEEGDKVVKVGFAEDDQYFIITVLNEKPLIAKEHQNRVFKKGFSTKGVAGNGLGLAIVKELTEEHHGTVSLVSNVDAGTMFTLNFPKESE